MIGRRGLLALWIVGLLACAWPISRARFDADLSAFLPRHPSPEQALLVEQLRDGVAARVLLVALEGGDETQRAQWSVALAGRLRASGAFAAVENGAIDADAMRRYAPLFTHRYVLGPHVDAQHFSIDGLRAAIGDTIASLTTPSGAAFKGVFTRDPTGESFALVMQAHDDGGPAVRHGVWASPDGTRALLLATTRAASTDLDGQAHAIETVHAAFDAIAPPSTTPSATPSAHPQLVLSGPGVFAVASRDHIRNDVTRLSMLGSIVVIALLGFAFGSWRPVLLAIVPVASGVVAAIAAVASLDRTVHGVTIGFGVALIGEAVDYGIYALAHGRGSPAARAHWWPTVRLGLWTSVCGFAALTLSGFPGLAQLGVFACVGLIVAAIVTRYVMPALDANDAAVTTTRRAASLAARALALAQRARVLAMIACAIAVAGLVVLGVTNVREHDVWSHELLALSPIGADAQQRDATLRAQLGAPDARVLVVVEGPDAQAVLETSERVDAQLDAAVHAGRIAGYDAAARWWPSVRMQRARQAALPDAATLRARLAMATQALPVSAARLDAFVDDVARARDAAPIDRTAFDGTPIAAVLDALLIERAAPPDPSRAWVALIVLRAAPAVALDAASLARDLEPIAPERVHVLDLKRAADALYTGYLHEAFVLVAVGALAIVVLLAGTLRSMRRVVRVLAPLVAAVATTVGALAIAGTPLTLLHLVGLLLIVAVGSNYALFFDLLDRHPATDPAATRVSLVLANLATVASFGLLAASHTPTLRAIGATVGPGALLALLFSAAWTHPRSTH